jgi:hypothetical protein
MLPYAVRPAAAPEPAAADTDDTLAAVRRLRQERDDLAHELAELRQQIALHESRVVRVRRWAQPN